jgi:hypothetical protein
VNRRKERGHSCLTDDLQSSNLSLLNLPILSRKTFFRYPLLFKDRYLGYVLDRNFYNE